MTSLETQNPNMTKAKLPTWTSVLHDTKNIAYGSLGRGTTWLATHRFLSPAILKYKTQLGLRAYVIST